MKGRIETYAALDCDAIVVLCYCEVIHRNVKHDTLYCPVSN
jgi:hypothetical protein